MVSDFLADFPLTSILRRWSTRGKQPKNRESKNRENREKAENTPGEKTKEQNTQGPSSGTTRGSWRSSRCSARSAPPRRPTPRRRPTEPRRPPCRRICGLALGVAPGAGGASRDLVGLLICYFVGASTTKPSGAFWSQSGFCGCLGSSTPNHLEPIKVLRVL